MPLDAISLRAVVEELRPQLLNLRIDKVQQPARDQVILLLRGNKRLLLNAGANAPRLQLTELLRDNPAEPPMFCMLLRKHLVGARVAEITQPGLERLVRIELDVTDDFGQPGHRTLVLEAMGRRSNLILLDGENRVIDCMRRVDAEMSAARQVLPGLFYEPPASTGRLPFLEETEEGLAEKLAQVNPEIQLDRFLLDAYFGISPLMARELSFRACGETDGRLCNLDEAGKIRFQDAFFAFANCVKENRFTPIVLKREGVPFEFSALPVHQYGLAAETETFESFSALLDSFYEAKERQERVRQRGADLIRTATTARDRVRRKLALQEKDYAATQTLTRQQRIVFDDALYIDLGGEASEYTAASNGKLTAYMMMHELDFVVTSDEVLEYYKDTFPMEDLEALLPADLREALADQLFFNTDADGKTTAIALDMTQSRFVAGTGADADPNVQHTYYFFVPAGAPHPEQIVQFLRYSFGL